MENPFKVGRLKKNEQDYILANADKMSVEDISEKLNRSPKQVKSTIERIPSLPKKHSPVIAELRIGLKESALWKTLKDEFDSDELVFFEEQYLALMAQFRQGNEEVLHTEENQVFKVIKMDILKHRNAIRQKRNKKEIERNENIHEHILKSGKLTPDKKADLDTLELKISSLLAQQSQFSSEYVKLEEKHQKLMEALKATREQRVDKINNGKIDFLGLLRTLDDDKIRDENEKYIEMMRRATKSEKERLTELYTFSDGEPDYPLLSEDTFLDKKEEVN